jgi:hypothetical protein
MWQTHISQAARAARSLARSPWFDDNQEPAPRQGDGIKLRKEASNPLSTNGPSNEPGMPVEE